ncbi:MAG: class I SAM-dependent methyltransferase, partial [bacterium]
FFKQFISQDYKVLVVNCGLGELPRFLKKVLPKAEIWATEESLFALDYCRQTNKKIYFANHPVDNPEFEPEYFDIIFVENFNEIKDKEGFMKQMGWVRAPRSIMVATVPISYWNPNKIKKFFYDKNIVKFHSSQAPELIFSVRWLIKDDS